jgi:hypothetical protein
MIWLATLMKWLSGADDTMFDADAMAWLSVADAMDELLRLSTAVLSTATPVQSIVCYVCQQEYCQLPRLSTALSATSVNSAVKQRHYLWQAGRGVPVMLPNKDPTFGRPEGKGGSGQVAKHRPFYHMCNNADRCTTAQLVGNMII